MRCFRYLGATCLTPYLPGLGPPSLEISSQRCCFVLCSKMLVLPCCWGPCSLSDPLVPCCWGPSSLLDARDHVPAQHLPPHRCYWASHPWRATHPVQILYASLETGVWSRWRRRSGREAGNRRRTCTARVGVTGNHRNPCEGGATRCR